MKWKTSIIILGLLRFSLALSFLSLPTLSLASESLDAYFDTGDDTASNIEDMQAQVFTALSSGSVPYVDMLVSVGSCSTGSITLDIRATTGSAPVTGAQTNIAERECSELSGVNWVRFTFPVPETIVASTEYAITFTTDDNASLRMDTTSSPYAGGERYYCTSESPNGTCSTWLIQTGDFLFRVYKTDVTASSLLV